MKHILTTLCCVIISTAFAVIITMQLKPKSPEISINEDGFWVIDGNVTDVCALGTKGEDGDKGDVGEKGESGVSPTVEISEDGYWVINGIATNVKATPEKPETSALGLDFFLQDDGSYAVGIGNAKYLSEIIIPEEYNKRPVTSIIAYGFSESEIQSIHIPESITAISEKAFSKCKKLERVYIENLESWCNIDFQGEEESSNPLHSAKELYVNNMRTETVTIPSACVKIAPRAFTSFEGIRKLIISDSTTEIGVSAFSGCKNLSSVKVGKSVVNIADDAFSNCTNLLEIYNLSPTLQVTKGSLSAGNIAYYALDVYESESEASKLSNIGDFIFRKDGDKVSLVAYLGDDSELTLPESLCGKSYEMKEKLFYRNATVKSVIIPSSVMSIGASCFADCTSLEYVIIGTGVAYVGNSAFSAEFEGYYYMGSETEWSKIQFADGNDNVKFLAKYYSPEEPEGIAQKYWYFLNGTPTLWK